MSPVMTWKIKRHAEGKDSDCSPKLETFSSYEKRPRTQEQRELGSQSGISREDRELGP